MSLTKIVHFYTTIFKHLHLEFEFSELHATISELNKLVNMKVVHFEAIELTVKISFNSEIWNSRKTHFSNSVTIAKIKKMPKIQQN